MVVGFFDDTGIANNKTNHSAKKKKKTKINFQFSISGISVDLIRIAQNRQFTFMPTAVAGPMTYSESLITIPSNDYIRDKKSRPVLAILSIKLEASLERMDKRCRQPIEINKSKSHYNRSKSSLQTDDTIFLGDTRQTTSLTRQRHLQKKKNMIKEWDQQMAS